MKSLLGKLKRAAPANYRQFSAENKETLGALINHVRSLSTLLNKTILANAS
ncbi:hypothetical protein BSU04_10310 [Caballeronia sordidicola]|uniref:Uncharacterized protein n=2 Tax=Caballeronia sordidicola TaxID=196367 RepID=A0A226X5L9_CABSO|nr:hypothetical protein BSU04_10310 [Caballeronia sordidicola]